MARGISKCTLATLVIYVSKCYIEWVHAISFTVHKRLQYGPSNYFKYTFRHTTGLDLPRLHSQGYSFLYRIYLFDDSG